MILDVIERLPIQVVLASEGDFFDQGLGLHRLRRDKEWSLTDYISFVLMQQHGLTAALAYDQHFKQAGFEALLRHEPYSPTEE